MGAVVSTGVVRNVEGSEEHLEFMHNNFIYAELQKAKKELNNPGAKFYTAEEVFAEMDLLLRERGL